jgi:riboflavin kinase / FMN adenylyltransferase
MTILRSLDDLSSVPGPVVLAFGMFDGVHRGHLAVLETATHIAEEAGGSMVVFTFDPHPTRVLRPDLAPKLLAGPRHQMHLLSRAKVQRVLLFPFSASVAAMTAEFFLSSLQAACPSLHAIVVGENWRFGHRRAGDVAMLRSFGAAHDFQVHSVEPVRAGGEIVSSTRIRHAVKAGELNTAAALLGRPYSVFGEVVHGDQLARKLGFPTANIRVENEQLPPAGVYAVRVTTASQSHSVRWSGVANLGHRPTVTPAHQDLSLEVHLFGFDGDLYHQELEVEFIHFLRTEKKFPDLAALQSQIAADAAAARLQLADSEPTDTRVDGM